MRKPWGTPAEIDCTVEKELLNFTFCTLSKR